MKIKKLIVTKYKWKNRDALHEEMRKIYLQEGNGIEDITFYVLYKDVGTPKTYTDEYGKQRIDNEWFEENISRHAKIMGFNSVCFQFSNQDGDKWGIARGHRGLNIRDKDFFGESWVKCDENSVRKYQDGKKRNTYVVDTPHEDGHEMRNQEFTTLLMHDFDYQEKINNIEGFYRKIHLSKKEEQNVILKRIIDLSQLVIKLLTQKRIIIENMQPFFEKNYPITQAFGVKNPIYSQTGKHLGTDFATPIGTPVIAPSDGYLTVGRGAEVGLYAAFAKDDSLLTYQFLHLSKARGEGRYKKGEIIAYTGNSGSASTGPHCCVRLWQHAPNIAVLNKTNVNEHLLDVMKV